MTTVGTIRPIPLAPPEGDFRHRITLSRNGRLCPTAFDTLEARYGRQIRTIAAELAPGWEDDVVQETYLRVCLKATVFDEAVNQVGFLYTLARHAAADLMRAEARAQRSRADRKRAGRAWAAAERRQHLDRERLEAQDLIARAPASDRVVLQTQLDGLTPAEAAAALGLTESAYRSRWSRAARRVSSQQRRAG